MVRYICVIYFLLWHRRYIGNSQYLCHISEFDCQEISLSVISNSLNEACVLHTSTQLVVNRVPSKALSFMHLKEHCV